MLPYVKKRALDAAYLMLEKNLTIREIAKELNVSKSTIHYDLSLKLLHIDFKLSQEIAQILKLHYQERLDRAAVVNQKKNEQRRKVKDGLL